MSFPCAIYGAVPETMGSQSEEPRVEPWASSFSLRCSS